MYKDILSNIWSFVKSKFYDIMLFIMVALLIFFAFGLGLIASEYQVKHSIEIESLSRQ